VLSPWCEDGRQKHRRRNHGSALQVRAIVVGRRNQRQQLLSGWPTGLYRRFGGERRRQQQQSPFERGREEAGYKWGEGEKSSNGKNSDTKLRIIWRLNLLVSQPFLYICVGQYTIVMVDSTTQEYDYNISYIQYFLYSRGDHFRFGFYLQK